MYCKSAHGLQNNYQSCIFLKYANSLNCNISCSFWRDFRKISMQVYTKYRSAIKKIWQKAKVF
jgi:hypothetical protein